ncbi:MAG: translation initiation factor [Bacteroidaceae bacterium]|nr:translation initiation factor [Bacteroidaceae bacterium]
MANNNDWKSRLGMVYSTNPDFVFDEAVEDEVETLSMSKQKLRVSIEKKGRGGKTVTLVKGFVGKDEDLKALAKSLKTKCGVGGAVKDNEIVIQGDLRDKVVSLLKTFGYSDVK